jgi:multidrug efflux pump
MATTRRLRAAAEEVMAAAARHPRHARRLQLAWGERAPTLRLELDRARVAELGLSPQQVASSLQLLLTGVTATQHREGDRLVDVVLRAPAAERLTMDTLADLSLGTPAGPVPLSQVARLVPRRRSRSCSAATGRPILTVRADIAPGLQAPDVTRPSLRGSMP